MSDEPTTLDAPSAEPPSAEPPSAEPPSPPPAPPGLRIALLLARRGEVLLGRPAGSEQGATWQLPNSVLAGGESFVAAARRIAAGALGAPLTLVNFQRLTLAPEVSGASASVTLGLYAEVDPASEASGANWLFFALDSLPDLLALDAEAALRAFLSSSPIVDLGGEALAFGYGRQLPLPPPPVASPPTPAAATAEPFSSDFKPPITQAFVLFSTAVLLAGGLAWLTGLGVAVDHHRWVRAHRGFQVPFNAVCAITILVLALRKGSQLAAAATRWRAIFRSVGSIVVGVALFGALVFVAGKNPVNDDPHGAFWCWFLALPTTALGLHLLRPRSEAKSLRLVSKVLWASLTLLSLVTVFPPLQDALFPRGGSVEHSPDAPPPSDD